MPKGPLIQVSASLLSGAAAQVRVGAEEPVSVLAEAVGDALGCEIGDVIKSSGLGECRVLAMDAALVDEGMRDGDSVSVVVFDPKSDTLEKAVRRRDSARAMRLLSQAGVVPRGLNDVDSVTGKSLLHLALELGLPEVALTIVRRADFREVNARSNPDGATALHVASRLGHLDVCEALVRRPSFTQAGADLTVADAHRYRPLPFMQRYASPAAADDAEVGGRPSFTQAGADLTVADAHRYRPLPFMQGYASPAAADDAEVGGRPSFTQAGADLTV
eukprot:CAMPEP_0113822052 /NCGR_PEP_ID=MMETSP0328-20130328/2047_1 /TAXON_ID=39455 /ORGANISM="Alexandrium minutum" /LENGTH=274 /DNA_ID=CAMNT_0000789987 /DNA_START=13 /DNA_END=831 /DNA_ORIENTATION=- /assembly_acc=CAM_ASM_000350